MKNKTILAALLALPLLAGAAAAQDLSSMDVLDQVARVQQAIKAQGARWEAGETTVSGMSREEFRNYIGFVDGPVAAKPAPAIAAAALPPALDWRDNGGSFVTIPKDQKKCGSCWAFSMTGALESYVLRAQNKPGWDLDLSEQVMLSCSGAGSCNGGRLTANFLTRSGLPAEEVFPYNATDAACSGAAPGWQANAYKIVDYGFVSRKVEALKAALNAYGPLPTAYWVYEDFKLYKGGIYSYTTGKKLGGHAVLLVGYNDAEKYFIVKNSWTPQWGENGFFRIAYSEVNGKSSFGLMTIAYYNAKEGTEAAVWQRESPNFDNITWN